MTIRFIKSTGIYKRGSTYDLPVGKAQQFILRGVARADRMISESVTK